MVVVDDDNNKGVMAKNYDMCLFQVSIVEQIRYIAA